MRTSNDYKSNKHQENVTHSNNYTHTVQTYFEYNGCLPKYEDEADHIKYFKVTKIA